MISLIPTHPLYYNSGKYHTLSEKRAAIVKKNLHADNNTSGLQEMVWYPGNIPILCWINRESSNWPRHWHPAVEIIMPIDGGYTVLTNENRYELSEGDILLLPPGEMHELIAPPEGYRLIVMFDYAAINRIPGFSALSSLLTQPIPVTQTDDAEIYEQCRDILVSIINLYADDGSYWDMSIDAYLIHLMVLLNKYYKGKNELLSKMSSVRQTEYMQKFNSVFEYIDQHYMEDIDLETVAKSSGFSKFHFSRIFKQITNSSFNDYLNNRRIQAAVALLSTSALPITEIALMSGFPSISTFNRVFRSIKHCTPSEFKKLKT